MSSPDQDDKSAAAPLDAERERLRKAGYTDAEVSQILITRAASQQPAGIGQGAMSNVLSSILGVASHARALIPTFRKDVETVFNGAATASARAGATASLAVKAIVIIVLGYAAWQEWQQHIIYATQIAESQARKIRAEECSARVKALVDSEPASSFLSGHQSPAVKRFHEDCDSTYAATAPPGPSAKIQENELPDIRRRLREALPATISDSEVDRLATKACVDRWGADACRP